TTKCKDGDYNLVLDCTDAMGNSQSSSPILVHVLNTVPKPTLQLPTPNVSWKAQSLVYNTAHVVGDTSITKLAELDHWVIKANGSPIATGTTLSVATD